MLAPAVRLTLLFVFALFVSPALAQDKPAPTGKRFALLVGVNEYDKPGLPPLKFAERDAEKAAEVLRANGYEVRLLLGSKTGKDAATRENILAVMKELFPKAKQTDLLVVGFAGHGQQLDKKPYIYPKDAQKDDPKSMVLLADVQIEMEKHAGARLLLVDACRDEAEVNRGIDKDGVQFREGTAVFLACQKGQLAQERADLEHGVFFHCVLQGLRGHLASAVNGKGEVTSGRLGIAIAEEFDKKFASLPQRPQIIGAMPPGTVLLQTVVKPDDGTPDMVQVGPAKVLLERKPTVAMTLSSDANLLAALDKTGTVRLFAMPAGTPAGTLVTSSTATLVQFSPDGKLLAVGGPAEITVWDVAKAKCTMTLKPTKSDTTLTQVLFTPNNARFFAITSSPYANHLHAWFLPDLELEEVLPFGSMVPSAACPADKGALLVVAGLYATPYDLTKRYKKGESKSLSGYAFADQLLAASGTAYLSFSGKAVSGQEVDAAGKMSVVLTFEPVGNAHMLHKVAGTLTASVIVTAHVPVAPDAGMNFATLRVWARSGSEAEEIAEFKRAHVGLVEHLIVTPDGKQALTAGSDGTVKLWPLPVKK